MRSDIEIKKAQTRRTVQSYMTSNPHIKFIAPAMIIMIIMAIVPTIFYLL